MKIPIRKDPNLVVVSSETGYSWTNLQLKDYEESWARDHDHQDGTFVAETERSSLVN